MLSSVALLLAATVLLAAGVVQEVLGLLYLSTACSVAAGTVLAVAVRRAGRPPGVAPVSRLPG